MVTEPGILGAGVNVASIYERGGTRPLFTVPAVSTLEWGRVLDATSKGTIVATPARSEGSWGACCRVLEQVQPWAHEVVIHRSGERVWEGPVRRVAQSRAGVTIHASDVTGWATRRVQTATITGVVGVIDQAVAALTAVFTGAVSNVTGHITLGGAETETITLDVPAGGYWSALLQTLTGAGLSYTTVGRRIILWDDPTYAPGLTAALVPTLHLSGDVETAREGDELAVNAYAVNDEGGIGSSTAADTYYGPVERTFNVAGLTEQADLDAAAARWRAYRYPLPETVTLPSNGILGCDAPFPIASLVPGVITPVHITDLCWPVNRTMRLTGVTVKQDAGGEQVTVDYEPISGDETPGEAPGI